MKRRVKTAVINLSLILVLMVIFFAVISVVTLPDHYQIIKGNKENLNLGLPFLPFEISINSRAGEKIEINGDKLAETGLSIEKTSQLAIRAFSPGEYNLNFRLFGIIPLRKMVVKVIPEVKVIPGGQCIGVIMKSEGIMVVKNSYVIGEEGEKHFPAQKAGVEVGDSLLSVNGVEIKNKYHLAKLINEFGEEEKRLKFKIEKQNGKIVFRKIKPVKSKKGYYMIGIYVDDGAAGVGTMSFYHPQSGYYGALGHMITEVNTNLKIDVKNGEIVEANISGINQGRNGAPGEKLGTFYSEQGTMGNIMKNNHFGIYGKLDIKPENRYFDKPISVASPSEVKKDTAWMYTVLEGNEIKKFKVKIEEVKRQHKPTQKGLIIKVTDSRLLKKTGGIIQGMSGSPIVQNNKFVGVVTHVFVNDSTRGYGVLGQWMIMKSGLLEEDTRELVS